MEGACWEGKQVWACVGVCYTCTSVPEHCCQDSPPKTAATSHDM